MTTLILTEHKSLRHARQALTDAQGEALLSRFGKYVDVQFPTPRTSNSWEIMSKGWIGALAVDPTLTLVFAPKVPIGNLARMLATVYDLDVEDFSGLISCESIRDIYDQLAGILAKRVLQLTRQGLQQAYRPLDETRTSVRGRLLSENWLKSGAPTKLRCAFSERTGDILENRILLWALSRALHSQLCSEETQARVRQAYRQLSSVASVQPMGINDCASVKFDRLTERYRPSISLSRIIIEGASPIPASGQSVTVPFLLHMPTLFERFVVKWLSGACVTRRTGLFVQGQEHAVVGDGDVVEFRIDIVLYREDFGRAVCVLDTKYKDASLPSASDVAQVGYYALLKRTSLATLVYPNKVKPWEGRSGDVATFCSSFDLSGDLGAAGNSFLEVLLARISTN